MVNIGLHVGINTGYEYNNKASIDNEFILKFEKLGAFESIYCRIIYSRDIGCPEMEKMEYLFT